MTERHDIPAIVTSLNVNGLAVTRVLGRHRVPVIAIHDNREEPETASAFVDELWVRDRPLVELLLHQGPRFPEPPVLFPITDDAVLAIAAGLDELRRFYRIAMPKAATVRRLIDKVAFDAWARELEAGLDLRLPATFVVEDDAGIETAIAGLTFPCIFKPPAKSAAFEAAGGRKAFVLDDGQALRATWARHRAVAPRAVVQQFIPGGDDAVWFCLQACGEDHEPLLSFTGRKLRQWRPHCGGTAACEPVDAPALASTTAAFFRAVGMVGPCSMEFKRDPRDGAFHAIEPTVCRTDWQNGVADANGHPIAYASYRATLGLPAQAATRPWLRRRWVQFGADRLAAHHYRTRGELGRIAWLWSIRPPVRGAYFAFDDPRPFLRIVRHTIARALRRLTRRRTATGPPRAPQGNA